MRCFIYCRVSTEEQSRENHYSLQYQEEASRHRIKEKDWHLYKVRQDVGSGKATEHREGYLELIQTIKGKKIDAVIVYKLDRLSRNVRDVYDFLELTQEHGVEFISLTEGFDTTTPMGRAMLGIAAVFAQLTRETIAENVRHGLEQRAKSGQWTGASMAPYGYDYTPEDGLTINSQEGEMVRRVFDLYTARKLNHAKIARLLNTEGIPSRTGKQWSSSSIGKMLRNPVYAGKIKYGSLVADGRHQPIVTEDQFEESQDLAEGRQWISLHPRTRTGKLLLLGLGTCGYCGRNLATKSNRGRTRYGCSGNQKVGDDACDGFIKADHIVDDVVVDRIREVARSEVLQEMAADEARRVLETTVEPAREERDRLLEELGRIGDDFTRWANRLDRGIVDEDQFEQHNRTLLARKTKIQARLTQIEEGVGEYERVEVDLEEVKAALAAFDELWEEGTLEERKAILGELVEDLRVTRDTAVLKLRFLPEEELVLPRRIGRPRKG